MDSQTVSYHNLKVIELMKLNPLKFSKNFTWGVATAAPQIEGAAFIDGKGASIWDTFCRIPGKVHNGDTLDHACDHYYRYTSDVKLMQSLGLKNYRLSLAWPRILPQGTGKPNPKGIAFYDRLIDTLLAHNITPWVTMFHWDLPQALEDSGGWRDRCVVTAFAGYADLIVKKYGDRVKNWITINEIYCFTMSGYGHGLKAPGTQEGAKVINQTYHHALLAHGHGVRAVREHGGKGARVGLTDNSNIPVPLTYTQPDIDASRALFVEDNVRVLDPIYKGYYPKSYLAAEKKNAPRFDKKDFDLISLPTDFLGMNIYTGYFARCGKNGKPERLAMPEGYPTTSCQWIKILPQAIYWGPRHACEIYEEKAIYITANGAGYDEAPPVKGEVHDLDRKELVRNYLKEVHQAISDGVPIKGYFLWSLMDNYEWEDGYNRRFGIVYNDFKTQKRTPKLSALWYQKVIATNTLV